MSTQTNGALRELIETLLSESKSNQIFDGITENAEAFARALIARCPDLAIVPRAANREIERAMLGSRAKDDDVQLDMLYDLLEFRNDNRSRIVVRAAYAAAIAATQPAAQEK